MTPTANIAPWPRAASARSPRSLIIGVLIAVALLGIPYLGGLIFLKLMHIDLSELSIRTLPRYAYYYQDRTDIEHKLLLSTGLATAVCAAVAVSVLRAPRRELHGAATFASRREIASRGLLERFGLILGRIGGRFLILGGQQGVAICAPTRSGKGVSIVIPNLLTWPGSVVNADIKRENWRITSGYRASRGQPCYLFDPLSESGDTACWNPFTYVSDLAHLRVNDLQRIASMFYAETPGTDPFWVASARSLFLGIALYVFETPSLPRTIGEVLRQGMASDDEGFATHWKRIINGRQSGSLPLSDVCVRALSDVIDLAPVTASSIRKTFTSRLDLWLNPLIDAATSQSDFDLRNLRRTPMSIYVAVNPDDLHRLRPLLSLFFEQAIGLQTRVLPEHDASLKHQVLMLLDECPALGYIPILAESSAYAPGYNVRLMMVFQAPSQLNQVYGFEAAKTILKNLAARIVFAPKDYEDAKSISDELGTLTVKTQSFSRSRDWWAAGKSWHAGHITTSDQARALLLPQEVRDLGAENQLIFYEGLRPILCKKIRYYNERKFLRRLLPPQAAATPHGRPLQVYALAKRSKRSDPIQSKENAVSGLNTELRPAERPDAAPAVREATLEDIERIESLTIGDFDVDLSKVSVPEGRDLSAEELEGVVERFMTVVRES